MDKNTLLRRSKEYRNTLKFLDKKELAIFAKQQFRHLMEKNLRVPVKLYHL